MIWYNILIKFGDWIKTGDYNKIIKNKLSCEAIIDSFLIKMIKQSTYVWLLSKMKSEHP